MKNQETYAKELAGIPFSELAMTKDGKICRCKEILCRDCAFYERRFPFCREAERIEAVVHTEIARLTAEVAELRERLEKAVELPVRIGDPTWYVVKNAITPWIVSTSVTEITIYEDEIVVNLKNTPRRLVFDYNGEVIGNYYEIYLDKNSAEERLKELQGGGR